MGVEAQGEGHVAEDVLGSEVYAFPRVRYQLYVGYGWVVCDRVIQIDSLNLSAVIFCYFELQSPVVFKLNSVTRVISFGQKFWK